jgi:hypothetical protein
VGQVPDLPINKCLQHVTEPSDLNQTIETPGKVPVGTPEVFLIENNPADVLLTRQALSKYPIPLGPFRSETTASGSRLNTTLFGAQGADGH